MSTYLEHSNVTVNNIEDTVNFIQTALPEFKIRHQGMNTKRWCHIGTELHYLALQEREPLTADHVNRKAYYDIGLNHIGIVVDDINAVSQRLLNAGFRDHNAFENEAFRQRFYVFDKDGIEWEFIEYSSKKAPERNLYEQ